MILPIFLVLAASLALSPRAGVHRCRFPSFAYLFPGYCEQKTSDVLKQSYGYSQFATAMGRPEPRAGAGSHGVDTTISPT